MAIQGKARSIPFWIADVNDTPISGLTLSSFTVTFTRDGVTATDTLSLADHGGGSYTLGYTPSAVGTDQIKIDDLTNDLHYQDIEVIVPIDSLMVTVTENYGGSGVLRPAASFAGSVLYAFLAVDWNLGRSDPSYAQGAYLMDATGNWSLDLLPATYNLVLESGAGAVTVFKFNLVVAPPVGV